MRQAQSVIAKASQSGFKSSEFWLSLAAMFSPYIIAPQTNPDAANNATPWWAPIAIAVANAVIAGAYALGRSLVKRRQVDVAPLYDGARGLGGASSLDGPSFNADDDAWECRNCGTVNAYDRVACVKCGIVRRDLHD